MRFLVVLSVWYVSDIRQQFHLCANCFSRREGVMFACGALLLFGCYGCCINVGYISWLCGFAVFGSVDFVVTMVPVVLLILVMLQNLNTKVWMWRAFYSL